MLLISVSNNIKTVNKMFKWDTICHSIGLDVGPPVIGILAILQSRHVFLRAPAKGTLVVYEIKLI